MFNDQHLHQLHQQGYVIIDISEALAKDITQLQQQAKAFFTQANAYKEQFRTPSLQGYLTPYPGLHEIFELKQINQDVALKIPDLFASSAWKVYQSLFEIGQQCLGAISKQLANNDSFLQMLDDSTFRLLHYDRIKHAPSEIVEQFIPAHPDSSLLTLSPKSSNAALEIKTKDLQWINIENELKPTQVVIFAGECLARLSNNYYWSLLHRPAISAMQQLTTTRIATPFFLRARSDVILETQQLNSCLIGTLDPSIAEAVSVADITDNVNHCRDNMPWKKLPYYL